MLFSGSDDLAIGVWRGSDGTSLGHVETQHEANILDVLPMPGCADVVVTAGMDGAVGTTRLAAARSDGEFTPLLSTNDGDAVSLDAVPGDSHVFLGAVARAVLVVDLRLRNISRALHADDQMFAVRFDPHHPMRFAAGGMGSMAAVYDLRMMGGAPVLEWDACATPLGATMVPEEQCVPPDQHISGLDFSREVPGLLAVNISHSHEVRLYDTRSLAPDPRRLWDGSERGSLKRMDLARDSGLGPTGPALTGHCNDMTFAKKVAFLDGGCVAAGSDDGRLYIWHAETGRRLRTIVLDQAVVNAVAPHPSRMALAVCGLDSSIKVLNVGPLTQRDWTAQDCHPTESDAPAPTPRPTEHIVPRLGDPGWAVELAARYEEDGTTYEAMPWETFWWRGQELPFSIRLNFEPAALTPPEGASRIAAARQAHAEALADHRGGDAQGALAKLRKAMIEVRFVAACPQLEEERRALEGTLYSQAAELLLSTRRWAHAEMAATAAILLKNDAASWFRRARARWERRCLADALRDTKRTLQLAPGDRAAALLLATITAERESLGTGW